jgi:hypothetical protein
MSFKPCSLIAATRMIKIIPDTLSDKKQLLKDFIDITCEYQSPEGTRRDYSWSRLYNIVQDNFTSEKVGEELYNKLVITYNQDEENDK